MKGIFLHQQLRLLEKANGRNESEHCSCGDVSNTENCWFRQLQAQDCTYSMCGMAGICAECLWCAKWHDTNAKQLAKSARDSWHFCLIKSGNAYISIAFFYPFLQWKQGSAEKAAARKTGTFFAEEWHAQVAQVPKTALLIYWLANTLQQTHIVVRYADLYARKATNRFCQTLCNKRS